MLITNNVMTNGWKTRLGASPKDSSAVAFKYCSNGTAMAKIATERSVAMLTATILYLI